MWLLLNLKFSYFQHNFSNLKLSNDLSELIFKHGIMLLYVNVVKRKERKVAFIAILQGKLYDSWLRLPKTLASSLKFQDLKQLSQETLQLLLMTLAFSGTKQHYEIWSQWSDDPFWNSLVPFALWVPKLFEAKSKLYPILLNPCKVSYSHAIQTIQLELRLWIRVFLTYFQI